MLVASYTEILGAGHSHDENRTDCGHDTVSSGPFSSWSDMCKESSKAVDILRITIIRTVVARGWFLFVTHAASKLANS